MSAANALHISHDTVAVLSLLPDVLVRTGSPRQVLQLRKRGGWERTDCRYGSTEGCSTDTDVLIRIQTGNKWEAYLGLLENGMAEGEALDALGLKRYVCPKLHPDVGMASILTRISTDSLSGLLAVLQVCVRAGLLVTAPALTRHIHLLPTDAWSSRTSTSSRSVSRLRRCTICSGKCANANPAVQSSDTIVSPQTCHDAAHLRLG